jgi:drug/metabolite transporter (DMT)-like permease
MVTGVIAILSGLVAAVAWGTGDFAGGLASRRAAAIRVVLVSQLVGVLALIALGIGLGHPAPQLIDLRWGLLAGLAGGLGLLLLYLSLARGKMGVAAPLTAVASGGIPLLVGFLTEGLPRLTQFGGFALALVAIWIISRPDSAGDFHPRDVLLPLLAGVGFGTFMALIGQVSDGAGFIWPLVATRATSMTTLLVVWGAVTRRQRGGARTTEGVGALLLATPAATTFPWLLAALAGLGDTAGNAFFALSAQTGRLDVAAVLSALYPAATVVLARLVLDERLTSRQSVGVGLALVAVALIAL